MVPRDPHANSAAVDESVPSQQGLKHHACVRGYRRRPGVDESVPSQQGLKHPLDMQAAIGRLHSR